MVNSVNFLLGKNLHPFVGIPIGNNYSLYSRLVTVSLWSNSAKIFLNLFDNTYNYLDDFFEDNSQISRDMSYSS